MVAVVSKEGAGFLSRVSTVSARRLKRHSRPRSPALCRLIAGASLPHGGRAPDAYM